MHFDAIDQKLMNRMQADFPLVNQPYGCIGQDAGIDEDEVIRRVGRLKTEGTIRQIGPLLDAKKINYKTTLVAMRVTGDELEKTAQLLANYPVSHAYERNHHFNLWFTLAVPAATDIDTELQRMVSPVKPEACFSLPALKLFKLRTYFSTGADAHIEIADAPTMSISQPEKELSEADKMVINEIQQDLPLEPHPFRDMATEVDMEETEFLEHARALLSRGVIRRFSASVDHRKVGFQANAMSCWAVPESKVEIAGRKLASLRAVSHCYERKTNPLWRYNIFAMIHAQDKEECQQIAADVSNELDLTDGELLFSTREFKKTRLRYPV